MILTAGPANRCIAVGRSGQRWRSCPTSLGQQRQPCEPRHARFAVAGCHVDPNVRRSRAPARALIAVNSSSRATRMSLIVADIPGVDLGSSRAADLRMLGSTNGYPRGARARVSFGRPGSC